MLLPFGIHRDLLSGIDWLAGGEEMISAAAILMLSSMLYSLRLSSGSFPKPLSAKEEQEYLEKAAAGDLSLIHI